jgi:lytic cellulose monooxygenase (C1-hydroxylating)
MVRLPASHLLVFASTVLGHGFLKSITVSGKNYLAWQVGQDNFLNPAPVRYARRLNNNGPVPDFTTKDIT